MITMPKETVIEETLGGYKVLELPLEDAISFINEISELLGIKGTDIEETLRIMRNFDVFYSLQQRKMKDFLSIQKSINDMLKGRVVVDKIKLVKKNNTKEVMLVLDRRVSKEAVVKALENIGYVVKRRH